MCSNASGTNWITFKAGLICQCTYENVGSVWRGSLAAGMSLSLSSALQVHCKSSCQPLGAVGSREKTSLILRNVSLRLKIQRLYRRSSQIFKKGVFSGCILLWFCVNFWWPFPRTIVNYAENWGWEWAAALLIISSSCFPMENLTLASCPPPAPFPYCLGRSLCFLWGSPLNVGGGVEREQPYAAWANLEEKQPWTETVSIGKILEYQWVRPEVIRVEMPQEIWGKWKDQSGVLEKDTLPFSANLAPSI